MSANNYAKNYAKFLPKHFDSFDCLKLAPGIYAILLLVLRAYIIWIMSVTNMRDNVGFIQWVYPQTALFYLNLASGVIGLFVVLILSLRRPSLGLLMHCLLVISAIVFIIKSKSFSINIAEFPEVLPEHNTRKHRKTKGLEID